MKQLLLLSFGMIFYSHVSSQSLTAGMGGQVINLSNLSGRKVNTWETDEIKGSPYLTKEYKPAQIIFRNGSYAENIPVKFSVYTNEIIFLNTQKEEKILDSVHYAVYYDVETDSTTVKVFASGYPAVRDLKVTTFYELLAGGKKYHLLKYRYKNLEPQRTVGYYHLKEYVDYTDYYVYTKGGEMIRIKLNENAIKEALPGMEERISSIVEQNKLNLRKEKDAKTLFNILDLL